MLILDRADIETVQADAFDSTGKVLVITSIVQPEALVQGFKCSTCTVAKPSKTSLVHWSFFKGQRFFKSEDLQILEKAASLLYEFFPHESEVSFFCI